MLSTDFSQTWAISKTIPSARRLKREKLCIVRYSYVEVLSGGDVIVFYP